ncbi:hypothetical protein TEA_018976 [Camellia sinensis var. sinensis]|uniref:Pentatricopeptide repeat-containing protein n=1 Tax=Camellia sinensis var. sinensis TaxID=542762 RepID=A0A4V3WP45_CAMSN|nr:hypothetical protein TEA_018976 [Camellia sinensis var. sinensis]
MKVCLCSYGRVKPDVAYGREIMGSKISTGLSSLKVNRKDILNPASMKQALVEGAAKLSGPNMYEQGAGRVDLLASYEILKTYQPWAIIFPSILDYTDCPYSWPFCRQPLYAGAMPVICNATILNGMGVIGYVESPPTWHPSNEVGNLLSIHFTYSDVIWPWTGYHAVYLQIKEEGAQFSGEIEGNVTIDVYSPRAQGEKGLRDTLLVDLKDEYFAEEIKKLRDDVINTGIGMVVFAEWYNVDTMVKLRFFDDNTWSWWTPVNGGANVPALNDLLSPFGIVFGDKILNGDFLIDGEQSRYASGTNIVKFPRGGYVHSFSFLDASESGATQNILSSDMTMENKPVNLTGRAIHDIEVLKLEPMFWDFTSGTDSEVADYHVPSLVPNVGIHPPTRELFQRQTPLFLVLWRWVAVELLCTGTPTVWTAVIWLICPMPIASHWLVPAIVTISESISRPLIMAITALVLNKVSNARCLQHSNFVDHIGSILQTISSSSGGDFLIGSPSGIQSHPNIKDIVPSQIVLEQWYDLVDYWKIMKVEAIAVHNAGRHSFHYINHTTRRTSFNQIRRKADHGMLLEDYYTTEDTRDSVFHKVVGSQSSTVAKISKQVSTELRQELRDEIREELREEIQAKLSTQIRQMKVEMLAILSQEGSTNHNKQVPDALSGHREPTDYEADENPCIPPPDDELMGLTYPLCLCLHGAYIVSLRIRYRSNLNFSRSAKILDSLPSKQQEEEESKRQRRERKKEKKEKAAEEEAEVDVDVAAMMGFGGFDEAAIMVREEGVNRDLSKLRLEASMSPEGVHKEVISVGFESFSSIRIGIVELYASCGTMEDAMKVFDEMPHKDMIVWNLMIHGFCEIGDFEMGFHLFRFFCQMWDNGFKLDEATVVSVLPVCARLEAVDIGQNSFHCFQGHALKNVVSWNAMISGLAFNGKGELGVDLFEEMLLKDVKLNDVTFVGVLACCAHVGLVPQGLDLFASMTTKYQIEPKLEHYGSMVNLLGRSGCVTEAHDLISTMPMNPNATIWGALLSACRTHDNMELAESAMKELIDLEPWNSGNYVLLSNVYAERGKWDEVEKVTALMMENKFNKASGQSMVG